MTDDSRKPENIGQVVGPLTHAAHVIDAILHAFRFAFGLWLVLWSLYEVFPMTKMALRDFNMPEPAYLRPVSDASAFVVIDTSPVAAGCLLLVAVYVACMYFCRWHGILATAFDLLIVVGTAILIAIVITVHQELLPSMALQAAVRDGASIDLRDHSVVETSLRCHIPPACRCAQPLNPGLLSSTTPGLRDGIMCDQPFLRLTTDYGPLTTIP